VAALVLTAGTFGDLYGRRKWLLIGAIGMFAGFVLQMFAGGITMLIGARLLVGCSTALTTALTLAVVNVSFVGASQSKAIGAFLGLGSLSAAITQLISEYLNQTFGWRFSFVIPLILCGLGIFMVFRYVPESKNEQARNLDIGGILFNAVGLAGIVYGCILAGTQGWTARSTLLRLAVGVVGLVLFVWWERRTPDPALKLSLFKNPVFTLAVFAALTLNLVDYGIQPTFSTFLQSVQGRTPFVTSILLLPWAMGAAIMAPIAGHWATRFSPRKLIALGLAAGAASLLLSLLLKPDSSPWLVLLIITPWALVYGVANIPRTSVLMDASPEEDSGAASGEIVWA
jgi:MFS family permease